MLVRAEWKVSCCDPRRDAACDLAGREALVDDAPHPHTTVLTVIEKTLTLLCSMRT